MGESGYGMYFLFGAVTLCGFAFVWFLIPETKAVPLDKMDRLFEIRPCSKAYSTVMSELQTDNFDRDEMLGKLSNKSEHAWWHSTKYKCRGYDRQMYMYFWSVWAGPWARSSCAQICVRFRSALMLFQCYVSIAIVDLWQRYQLYLSGLRTDSSSSNRSAINAWEILTMSRRCSRRASIILCSGTRAREMQTISQRYNLSLMNISQMVIVYYTSRSDLPSNAISLAFLTASRTITVNTILVASWVTRLLQAMSRAIVHFRVLLALWPLMIPW